MATNKTPSLLIPNFRDPQQEAFAKSVKAVTDHLLTQTTTNTSSASSINVATLQSQVAVLQATVVSLQAQINAISGETYTAATTITQNQVVYANTATTVSVADSSQAISSEATLGIASSSASAGQSVTVIGFGKTYSSSAWNLSPGEVYLGPNGTITQTLPVANSLWVVGYAVTATTIVIAPRPVGPWPQVFTEVVSGQPVVVPDNVTAYSPLGQGVAVNDTLLLDGALAVSDLPSRSIPAYKTVGATTGVHVPNDVAMLYSTQTGLVNNGTIINDGSVVGV